MKPVLVYPHKIYPYRWLTSVELELVTTKEIPEYLKTARTYCLISCLTGLRFDNIGRLTKDHFCKNEAGHSAIRFTTRITGEKLFIPVIPALQKILDELTSNPFLLKGKTLLPELGNAKRYANLQTLAEICDIPMTLNRDLCRNTFAEILYRHHVPIGTILEILNMPGRYLNPSYRNSENDILKDIQKAFYPYGIDGTNI
jgi:hypothetical protein